MPAGMPALTPDALVVGAGVMGTAIAFELARAGRAVLVVDKAGGVAHGSTSASSAIVRFSYSTYDGVATAWESQHCWTAWAYHLGLPSGDGAGEPLARFVRTGMVVLDSPVMPRGPSLRLYDTVGVPYEELDAATLAERFPFLDTGRYWPPRRIEDDAFWQDAHDQLGGYLTPDAGFVLDPRLASDNLADAARRHGAQLRFRAAVTSARPRAGGWRVGLADGTEVDTPVVVNAAGPWSGALNRLAGVGQEFTVGVRPLRQEVHEVPAPRSLTGDGTDGTDGTAASDHLPAAVADTDLGTYLRPGVGGTMLVGSTEPECDPLEWIEDPDAAGLHVTPGPWEAQTTRAARRLPDLGVPGRPSGVVGVYDAADDWTPIYDRTDAPGYYVAMGTSGNQFKNAPLVGRFLSLLVDRVESGHDHDAEPLRYRGEHTGVEIDLGAFSRKRPRNDASSGTVMG